VIYVVKKRIILKVKQGLKFICAEMYKIKISFLYLHSQSERVKGIRGRE